MSKIYKNNICKKCGAIIPENITFCTKCGCKNENFVYIDGYCPICKNNILYNNSIDANCSKCGCNIEKTRKTYLHKMFFSGLIYIIIAILAILIMIIPQLNDSFKKVIDDDNYIIISRVILLNFVVTIPAGIMVILVSINKENYYCPNKQNFIISYILGFLFIVLYIYIINKLYKQAIIPDFGYKDDGVEVILGIFPVTGDMKEGTLRFLWNLEYKYVYYITGPFVIIFSLFIISKFYLTNDINYSLKKISNGIFFRIVLSETLFFLMMVFMMYIIIVGILILLLIIGLSIFYATTPVVRVIH